MVYVPNTFREGFSVRMSLTYARSLRTHGVSSLGLEAAITGSGMMIREMGGELNWSR